MRATERATAYEQTEEWSKHPAEELEEACASDALSEEQAMARAETYFRLVAALEQQLADEGGDLDIEALRGALTDEELEGVRQFDLAVQGRVDGQEMLAEDRLQRLGDALALLQPVLSVGLHAGVPRALEQFDALRALVDELHEELVGLEDAQAEMFEQDREAAAAADADADPDADKDANQDGTENAEQAPAGSSLFDGDDVEVEPPAPTPVDGGPLRGE